MIDLNDVRLFVRVAALKSFANAGRELDIPSSSVSRGVLRLETKLGVRLLHRTTREVALTDAGKALLDECSVQLDQLGRTLDYVGNLSSVPRGTLSISTSIGFGINILSKLLPEFMRLYPDVDVVVELSNRPIDLVSERTDVAIRMGRLPDSGIVARKLGVFDRYCCAAPGYITSKGAPVNIEDLRGHDLVDFPVRDGHRFTWVFNRGEETTEHHQVPRVTVNCALTLHRMLLNEAGVGISPDYLAAPDIKAGRLIHLFPDWTMPPAAVHAVFPSRRDLAPKVRAFVGFMIENFDLVSGDNIGNIIF